MPRPGKVKPAKGVAWRDRVKRPPMPANLEKAKKARAEMAYAVRMIRFAARRLEHAHRIIDHKTWRESHLFAKRLMRMIPKIEAEMPVQACDCKPLSACTKCWNRRWLMWKQVQSASNAEGPSSNGESSAKTVGANGSAG